MDDNSDKVFAVDNKNGTFVGFIKAKDKNSANKKIKSINKSYKVVACLTNNKDRSVKSKYTYFQRTSGWKYSKET